jgi:hypothetical protein
MRFCCGVIFLIVLAFFIPATIAAQVVPDTIPAGVIIVQRQPVKAAFHVQKLVLYQEAAPDFSNLPARGISADSGAVNADNGPHPNYGEARFFSWNDVLKPMKYEYAWKDSTRTDSARFIYTIDKHGKAKCEAFPYENADSSGEAFQTRVFKYLVLLDRWTPARIPKGAVRDGGSTRTKRVACTVIITVYAYDPNAGRLVPLGPDR